MTQPSVAYSWGYDISHMAISQHVSHFKVELQVNNHEEKLSKGARANLPQHIYYMTYWAKTHKSRPTGLFVTKSCFATKRPIKMKYSSINTPDI